MISSHRHSHGTTDYLKLWNCQGRNGEALLMRKKIDTTNRCHQNVSILSLQGRSVNFTQQTTADSSPMSLDCSVQNWHPLRSDQPGFPQQGVDVQLFCYILLVRGWNLMLVGAITENGWIRQETVTNYDEAHADRTLLDFQAHTAWTKKKIINMQ